MMSASFRLATGKPGQAGFTLVELMIVLALSSILSAALFQVFLGNKKNVELLDSYSRIQESARYGMDYLARDMRMAGYMGCVNNDMGSGKITNHLDEADSEYDGFLHGFEASLSAIDNFDPDNVNHVNALPDITPVSGTDVFISSGALTTDLLLKTAHSVSAATLEVTGPQQQLDIINEGMVFMLTDCNTAHIFSASNTHAQTGSKQITHNKNVTGGPDNLSQGLGVNYVPGSQLLVMNTTVYFIAPSALVNGQNSLYRLSTIDGDEPQELVPYVDNMQLLYGVDSNDDGAPDVYKTAQEIADDGDDMKESVYSINIELVVSGNIDVGAQPLAGFADDGRLRKRYARAVNIRNAGVASY